MQKKENVMFTAIEHFKNSWTYESAATGKLLTELTDKSLGQAVANDHRTIGRLAWHIIQTLPEMGGRTGLKISGPDMKDPVPTSAAAIKDAYEQAAGSLLEQVTKDWTNETLNIEDDMYGQQWKRGMSLAAMINHEIHHRGQLTVLMRQAGLKVPGVYGPSKDEWTQYGMNPPAI